MPWAHWAQEWAPHSHCVPGDLTEQEVFVPQSSAHLPCSTFSFHNLHWGASVSASSPLRFSCVATWVQQDKSKERSTCGWETFTAFHTSGSLWKKEVPSTSPRAHAISRNLRFHLPETTAPLNQMATEKLSACLVITQHQCLIIPK